MSTDPLNTTDASNTTSPPLELTLDLFIAYTAIIMMALIPIYIGSYLSLDQTRNIMTKKDAYMFPVIGSCVLFGLYMLFRIFSKEYINMLLTAYFLFFGFVSLYETFLPVVKVLFPAMKNSKSRTLKWRFPWDKEDTVITFNHIDIVSGVVSFFCILWYLSTKNWLANNLLGLSFCIQGVSMISIGSYQKGGILLGGLFIYDVFWVFGTDVMVTVAKSFDAPIKLLFPKALLAEKYTYSMLGLGDIVIPGIFIALLLRYDAHRSNSRSGFPTPYFTSTFIGYALGLITTIVVMHTFQAAQPALLYLVPACLSFSSVRALLEKDLMGLFSFEEKEEEEQTTTKNKGNKKGAGGGEKGGDKAGRGNGEKTAKDGEKGGRTTGGGKKETNNKKDNPNQNQKKKVANNKNDAPNKKQNKKSAKQE
eukprot:TRINITY_DN13196_c0_g1_i1.p1 TRINITY_DN13196_c0_g1~~TRINITY_DN13196_c0_g1_i1.p1  ORF type:complete len:421 (+),score=101.80 TRINITY_DN13196_c0_g1_i1:85-1347(+)